MRRLYPIAVCLAFVVTLFTACSALAHFKLNQNVRVHHVVHSDDGVDVYLRMPMSYLVAGLVGPEGLDGLPTPAPYTYNQIEDGVLMHYVEKRALRRDPYGLAKIAADGIVLSVDGQTQLASIIALRLHTIGAGPGFATLSEAQAALAKGDVFQAKGEAYVGDVMVDLHLRYATETVDAYSLSYTSNPGLPGQDETANLVLDYNGQRIRTFRATGLMHDPVKVSGSATAAASTFVVEGIRHIIEGRTMCCLFCA